uniref:Farnesyl pyrophosphate synthase n=1 Tax=Stomoxys calcitrans TaxID=35570 RepID=A0A1I8Q9E8_STOCA
MEVRIEQLEQNRKSEKHQLGEVQGTDVEAEYTCGVSRGRKGTGGRSMPCQGIPEQGFHEELLHEAKDEILLKYKLSHLTERLTKALDYNLVQSELLSLKVLITNYKHFRRIHTLETKDLKSVNVLAGCIELVFMALDILNDIVVDNTTRFGQPSWHTQKEVGVGALNDAWIFRNMIFYMLRKHFQHCEYYLPLVELFHECILTTACGQGMDNKSSQMTVRNFKMKMHKSLTKNKAVYIALYLPIMASMYLAGIKNRQAYEQVKGISMDVGYYMQVHNEFLHSFDNPSDVATIGNDIVVNKCTWLAVQCIVGRASKKQKYKMVELYKELDMNEAYEAFESESIDACDEVTREEYNKIK